MNKCAPSLLGNTYYEGLDNCKAVGPEPTHKMSNWTRRATTIATIARIQMVERLASSFLFIFRRGFLRFRRFHAQRGRPGTQTTPNPDQPGQVPEGGVRRESQTGPGDALARATI